MRFSLSTWILTVKHGEEQAEPSGGPAVCQAPSRGALRRGSRPQVVQRELESGRAQTSTSLPWLSGNPIATWN